MGQTAMLTVAQALALAVQQHQAGQLRQAEQIYRAILKVEPQQIDALHLLGLLAYQQGRHELAHIYIRQALRLQPDFAEAHNNLGIVLQAQLKLAEAQASYQQALRLRPDNAEAHNNLGNLLQEQGQLVEAQACYQEALRHKPDYAEAFNNLANVLHKQGQLEEAVVNLRQALRLKPDYAEAHNNLGTVLRAQGQLAEAVASHQQALRCKPEFAEAYNNLGVLLHEQGRFAEALTCWQQALRLKPSYTEAYNNRGVALKDQKQLAEAVANYRQALECSPNLVEAHINLANACRDEGKLEEAAAGYQHALRLRPSPSLRLARATLLPALYASTAEITTWRAQLQDNLAQLHREQVTLDLTRQTARPLFFLAYQGLNDRDLQHEVARLYVAPPHPAGRAAGLNPAARGDPRIQVGFVSQHFRNHTIGELFRGVIAHLARADFAVTVFSLGGSHDTTAQFIQAHADTYVELPKNLRAARQQIAAHPLDVLVYPDIGMDELTYSLAFSRLAPVQCVTWGHPVTTGIPTIDYYLSSELFETAEAEQHYTETLVRLPELPCYCYPVTPPAALKGRDYFGLPAEGHVYACPQSLFKFHPDFDALLGGILRQDPHGVLVLNRADQPSYRHWEERLQKRFAVTLADVQERIRFLPRLSHAEYLNLNAVSDVILDTIHFNGGNTSLKALALGVPIVTLPSAYLRGRLTLALYKKMQVLDCVADTSAEYIQLAVRLGTEPDYRAHLRAKILEANAVLYENVAGVRALEGFLLKAARQA
jgi:protein O-GlcNAc transferase